MKHFLDYLLKMMSSMPDPPNDRTCPVCYNNYLYSINPTTFKKREKKFKNCIHTVCHNCYNNINHYISSFIYYNI